jgi:hypothetical protein
MSSLREKGLFNKKAFIAEFDVQWAPSINTTTTTIIIIIITIGIGIGIIVIIVIIDIMTSKEVPPLWKLPNVQKCLAVQVHPRLSTLVHAM